jgi:apolipoprotein N-acyltransferase
MGKNNNLVLSIASGLALSIAWPTYGFVGLLFFGFVPLLIVLKSLRDQNPKRIYLKSFGLAYLSFFIFNIITTHWLYFSTAFGMWFAVLANSALMALVFLIYQFIARRTSFRNSIIFLIALWIGFEKMHMHWELAWPWLNLGNAFSENINWVQWYEYTGIFGGSLWVLFVNALFFNAYLKWKAKAFNGVKHTILILSVIVLPIFISFFVKAQYPAFKQSSEIVVLQPNIDPYSEKYNTSNIQISNSLMGLIEEVLPQKNALILAPETVFAKGIEMRRFPTSQAQKFKDKVFAKYPKTTILSGISLYEIIRSKDEVTPQSNVLREGVWYNDFNSAFYAEANKPVEFYHKSKLVVGVENFPFKPILEPILGNVMLDMGGTIATKTTQDERSVFEVNEDLW